MGFESEVQSKCRATTAVHRLVPTANGTNSVCGETNLTLRQFSTKRSDSASNFLDATSGPKIGRKMIGRKIVVIEAIVPG